MIKAVEICKQVLSRLVDMDSEITYPKNERRNGYSKERLIFPNKKESSGDVIRISEQELRLLFIEKFLQIYPYYYSIETPTVKKYSFGKKYEDIKVGKGTSASHDLCIFEKDKDKYQRKLNIEFKHTNVGIKDVGKDIVKLICEGIDGVFIHLLDNTNSGTLCNANGESGVFDKLYESFKDWENKWTNEDMSIEIIILSLKQKTLIHRKFTKSDLMNSQNIFFKRERCEDIMSVNGQGWISYSLENTEI